MRSPSQPWALEYLLPRWRCYLGRFGRYGFENLKTPHHFEFSVRHVLFEDMSPELPASPAMPSFCHHGLMAFGKLKPKNPFLSCPLAMGFYHSNVKVTDTLMVAMNHMCRPPMMLGGLSLESNKDEDN